MTDRITPSLSNFVQRMTAPHRLLAVSVVRIALGTLTAIFYALHIGQRHVLWGPDGFMTWTDAKSILSEGGSWTLYQLLPSERGFEVIFFLGFLVTILYTIGFATRVTSVLFVLFTFSLYQRNYYAIDGGENLLIIIAFYLMFADLSAISLDRALGWARPKPNWFAGMLHNVAVTACLLQLAILYFVSDFFKIQGHVWSNGTALYYILRTNEFSLPPFTNWITQSEFMVVTGTYATIIFEAMYPWAIWHPRLKYAALAGVFLLHGGIAVFMGLVWFSMTMVAVDALFFEDQELRRMGNWLASLRLPSLARLAGRSPAAVAAVHAEASR